MDSSDTSAIQQKLRIAQREWASKAIADRSACAARFASIIAKNSRQIHAAIRIPQRRSYRETLSAELLPLAASARWLSKSAGKVLSPSKISRRGVPFWIGQLDTTIFREPFGTVLILGTWNYACFLPTVQALQALVAGNAVVLKPAFNCEPLANLLKQLLVESGIPTDLVHVTSSSNQTAVDWMAARVDKVIMTGSSRGGREVLSRLAETLTPSVMELSGCDSLFLLEDGDRDRFVDCIEFGLQLNGSATCMAPRRLFVPRKHLEDIESKLLSRLTRIKSTTIHPASLQIVVGAIAASRELTFLSESGLHDDSTLAVETIQAGKPLVVTRVPSDFALSTQDIFAPLAMLFAYENLEEAVENNDKCPYALTCSVFGSRSSALDLSSKLKSGTVIINDVVVPTADPRLPFGGIRESGFGVTRGREGLLEMTYPKVVSEQQANKLRHLAPEQPGDESILEGLLQLLYSAGLRSKWAGLMRMADAIRKMRSGDRG
jgi:aldehyde dehydrogenase (NAD+)